MNTLQGEKTDSGLQLAPGESIDHVLSHEVNDLYDDGLYAGQPICRDDLNNLTYFMESQLGGT